MIDSSVLRERPWLIGLLGASVVIILFFMAAATIMPGGLTSPPQSDTLMFFQYAQSLAHGHPYQYQAGDPCTTASTSHLYPLLLALPCWLGAHGASLVVCSLAFNVACYLAVVMLAGLALRRLVPEALPLGVALVALCGPLALVCLQQSDMGLFTALALGLFAALVYERWRWAAVVLTLAVWCRPEGSVMAGLLLICALLSDERPRRRAFALLGLWGLAQAVGVLLLNVALTGTPIFQSVVCKGHLAHLPPIGAMIATTTDFGVLIRELVLGLPTSGRPTYVLPLIGGLLMLTGLCVRLANREAHTRVVERWLALALLMALCLMATSGWQGFSNDRHLAWVFPCFAIYTAIGLASLAAWWPGWRGGWRLIGGALVVYQAGMLPLFAARFASQLQATEQNDAFFADLHASLPAGQRVGVVNDTSCVFFMPGRHVTHVGGYISTAFVNRDQLMANVEVLRHQPDQRFDVWLLCQIDAGSPLASLFLGERLAVEAPVFPCAFAMSVYRADWSTLAAPILPLSTNAVQAVAGLKLVDRLDVGYLPEERAHAYQLFTRIGHTLFHVSAATRRIGEARVTEAGRAVVGSESFRLHLVPHRPLRLVLRTAADLPADVCAFEDSYPAISVGFNPDSRLNILVDGESAGVFDVHLDTNATVWSEVVIDLPAERIQSAQPEITVAGDHVAMCYWAYQPDGASPAAGTPSKKAVATPISSTP